MVGTQVLAPADSASLMVCKDMLNLSPQTVNEILGSIMTSVRVERKNSKTGLVFDHASHIAPKKSQACLLAFSHRYMGSKH
nr:BPK_HP1_G0000040.mRNA.1.CDS.1 [Saccharomyces cerevisiae]